MKYIRGVVADLMCQSHRHEKMLCEEKLKVLLRVNQWPQLCLKTMEAESFSSVTTLQ